MQLYISIIPLNRCPLIFFCIHFSLDTCVVRGFSIHVLSRSAAGGDGRRRVCSSSCEHHSLRTIGCYVRPLCTRTPTAERFIITLVTHLHPFRHGYLAAHDLRSVQDKLAYVSGDGHERYRPGMSLPAAVGSVEAGYVHLGVKSVG